MAFVRLINPVVFRMTQGSHLIVKARQTAWLRHEPVTMLSGSLAYASLNGITCRTSPDNPYTATPLFVHRYPQIIPIHNGFLHRRDATKAKSPNLFHAMHEVKVGALLHDGDSGLARDPSV
jgi:hypothetical protein